MEEQVCVCLCVCVCVCQRAINGPVRADADQFAIGEGINKLFELAGCSRALRISGVTVPEHVRIGADALLQCHYDLEGSSLYALKWYKGSHEFYSYVPKEMPSIRVFPWTRFPIHAVSQSSISSVASKRGRNHLEIEVPSLTGADLVVAGCFRAFRVRQAVTVDVSTKKNKTNRE